MERLVDSVQIALDTKWPENNSVDAWGVWLDSTHHRHNRVSCVLGPAGSGKTIGRATPLPPALNPMPFSLVSLSPTSLPSIPCRIGALGA